MCSASDSNALDGLEPQNCDDILKILTDRVTDLYHYRDHYFETHGVKDSANRVSDIETELSQVIPLFNKYKDRIDSLSRARFLYLKGRALNVVPRYDKEVEELLSKCLKLDPKLAEAWNEWGECYWKNDNVKESTNCLNKALSLCKNKVTLRNLSMLARQNTACNNEERIKNIELGLKYAKEAVQLDPHDGESWAVLANAHLVSFFGLHKDPKTLKLCLSAYVQAEKDIVARTKPDLHYNKAVTLKYEEEFKLALESLHQAQLYDPTWEEPKKKEELLIKYLNDICYLVKTSGKMKSKRLQQLLHSLDVKQLGPFAGGGYTSSTGRGSAKLEMVPLASLKPGLNKEKVVLGKVVCSVHNEDTVPFTICMVDQAGTCVTVTIFNMAEGKGVIIGDSVAIPEPYVTDVDFEYKETEYKFRLIRVETPVVLVVNSKKLTKDKQAGVQMSVEKRLD